jgi:phage terminase large subunit-like protein
MAICDECHAWKDKNLYYVLNQSKSARTQPLIIVITTGGIVRDGIYDKLYEKSCRIIEGKEKDDTFYPFIYELDNKDQIDDEANWIMANPSLGEIKKIEDIRTDVNTAKFDLSAKTTMLTKDFNFRENASSAWLPFKIVEDSFELTFDIREFSGSYFVGGVDLSESGDLTAASILLIHGKEYCKKHNLNPDMKYVYTHYWIPENCVSYKIKHDKVPYDIWQQKGLVSYSGENRVNYDDVVNWFLHIRRDLNILPISIGYDEWNAPQFTKDMQNKGFKMEAVRQGYKTLSSSMKNLGYDFYSKLIDYNADPVMKWCLSNTNAKMDEAGNIKPEHPKDRQRRTDGVSSMLDAYVVMETQLPNFKNMTNDK